MSATRSSRKLSPTVVLIIVMETVVINKVRGNHSLSSGITPCPGYKLLQKKDSLPPHHKDLQENYHRQSFESVKNGVNYHKVDDRPGTVKSQSLLNSSFSLLSSSPWSLVKIPRENQVKGHNMTQIKNPPRKRLFFGMNKISIELLQSQNWQRQARQSKEWLRNLLKTHLVPAKLVYLKRQMRTQAPNSRLSSTKMLREKLTKYKAKSSSDLLPGNLMEDQGQSRKSFYTPNDRSIGIRTIRPFFKLETLPETRTEKHSRGKRSSGIPYSEKFLSSTKSRFPTYEGKGKTFRRSESNQNMQLSLRVFLTMKAMDLAEKSGYFDSAYGRTEESPKSTGKYYKIWIPRGLVVAKPDNSGFEDSTEMADALLQIMSKFPGIPTNEEMHSSIHGNEVFTGNKGELHQSDENDTNKVEKWRRKTSSSDDLFRGANWHELERLTYPRAVAGKSGNVKLLHTNTAATSSGKMSLESARESWNLGKGKKVIERKVSTKNSKFQKLLQGFDKGVKQRNHKSPKRRTFLSRSSRSLSHTDDTLFYDVIKRCRLIFSHSNHLRYDNGEKFVKSVSDLIKTVKRIRPQVGKMRRRPSLTRKDQNALKRLKEMKANFNHNMLGLTAKVAKNNFILIYNHIIKKLASTLYPSPGRRRRNMNPTPRRHANGNIVKDKNLSRFKDFRRRLWRGFQNLTIIRKDVVKQRDNNRHPLIKDYNPDQPLEDKRPLETSNIMTNFQNSNAHPKQSLYRKTRSERLSHSLFTPRTSLQLAMESKNRMRNPTPLGDTNFFEHRKQLSKSRDNSGKHYEHSVTKINLEKATDMHSTGPNRSNIAGLRVYLKLSTKSRPRQTTQQNRDFPGLKRVRRQVQRLRGSLCPKCISTSRHGQQKRFDTQPDQVDLHDYDYLSLATNGPNYGEKMDWMGNLLTMEDNINSLEDENAFSFWTPTLEDKLSRHSIESNTVLTNPLSFHQKTAKLKPLLDPNMIYTVSSNAKNEEMGEGDKYGTQNHHYNTGTRFDDSIPRFHPDDVKEDFGSNVRNSYFDWMKPDILESNYQFKPFVVKDHWLEALNVIEPIGFEAFTQD